MHLFCRGKPVAVAYSECVFVAFVILHAIRKRGIILSSVTSAIPEYYSALSHKRQDF
jgi:hypothetical protein